MIGGPIGALIGAFAGHKLLDKSFEGGFLGHDEDSSRLPDQAVFAAGVIGACREAGEGGWRCAEG